MTWSFSKRSGLEGGAGVGCMAKYGNLHADGESPRRRAEARARGLMRWVEGHRSYVFGLLEDDGCARSSGASMHAYKAFQTGTLLARIVILMDAKDRLSKIWFPGHERAEAISFAQGGGLMADG